MIRLAVDVEENHVRVRGDSPLDIAKQHGVLDLFLEKLDRLPALAVMGMGAVPQEVREHLDEMRFAGAKEPRHPHADLSGYIGIVGIFNRIAVGREELPEVLIELPGDHELVQFLPYRGVVQLIRFHDAIDRAKDVSFKEVLNLHTWPRSRNQLEGLIVVAALQLAKKPQGVPIVSAWIKHHQRRLTHNRVQVVEQGVRS